MKALEYATHIDLPDKRVAVCGDWHGNEAWVRLLGRALPTLAPDVTTILQLGDWWMDPAALDEAFAGSGINAIYVTLGNHEPWGQITPLLGDTAVRVSNTTWLLSRPARLRIGGRSVLSLGGATSVDKALRTNGVNWWPDEEITDQQVFKAISGGPADVMLTHDSPARTPVRAVREVLRTNAMRLPSDALESAAASRAQVSEVWNVAYPELLMHGHMHMPGAGITEDRRRVVSLGKDTQQGSLAILDMRSLTMQTPALREIRNAGER